VFNFICHFDYNIVVAANVVIFFPLIILRVMTLQCVMLRKLTIHLGRSLDFTHQATAVYSFLPPTGAREVY
jgi:hypothetical protein